MYQKTFVNGYNSVTNKINSKFNNDGSSAYVSEYIFLPGHETKEMVCQGIAYLSSEEDENKYVLLSYYPKKSEQSSQIIVVDRKSGKAIRRFALYKSEDNAYTGHAGGIAVAGKYLWVASGLRIYAFSTDEIFDFIADSEAKTASVDDLPDSFDALPAKDLFCEKSYSVDSKVMIV